MGRYSMVALVFPLLMGAQAGPARAEDPIPVTIAGQLVARLRCKGTYGSIAERARAVEQGLITILSDQDSEHPKVFQKKVDGVWHIFVGATKPVDLVAVYPEDAKPQHMDPKDLAAVWVRNITTQLPKATPVSKMDNPFGGHTWAEVPPDQRPAGVPGSTAGTTPAPGGTLEAPPTGTATTGVAGETGVRPAVGRPPSALDTGPAVRPEDVAAGAGGAGAGATTQPTPTTAAVSGLPEDAVVIILGAFDTVRELDAEQYLARRNEVARNLLSNIRPFVRSTGSSGPGVISVGPTGPGPGVQPGVTPAGGGEAPGLFGGGLESLTAYEPAPPGYTPISSAQGGTPQTRLVPQKERIKRKFDAGGRVFLQLKAQGDARVPELERAFSNARKARAAGDLNSAEYWLDQALTQMGLAIPG